MLYKQVSSLVKKLLCLVFNMIGFGELVLVALHEHNKRECYCNNCASATLKSIRG